MKKMMLPIQNLESLYNANNEIFIRHFPGDAAIQIRFDGNTGCFKYGEELKLTSSCEPFSFNPIAFRAFHGRPFESYKEAEIWIEMFGITEAKCTFRILLRGGSSTELNRFAYFLNFRPTETKLTLQPAMRHNKEFNKNYFVCMPIFTELNKADKKIMDDVKCMLYVYSSQFQHVGINNTPFVTIIAENYCNEDYINEDAFKYFQVQDAAPTIENFIPRAISDDERQAIEAEHKVAETKGAKNMVKQNAGRR